MLNEEVKTFIKEIVKEIVEERLIENAKADRQNANRIFGIERAKKFKQIIIDILTVNAIPMTIKQIFAEIIKSGNKCCDENLREWLFEMVENNIVAKGKLGRDNAKVYAIKKA